MTAKMRVETTALTDHFCHCDGCEIVSLGVPWVNMNGDAGVTLVNYMRNILDAMRVLQTAIGHATPHGRNWQTNPNQEAFRAAQIAWDERKLIIESMRQEFEELAIAINDQAR